MQRRHEEPRDAPVHAVRDAAVVALRELVGERRIGGRIAEARQQIAAVVEDVAVVCRDDAGALGREHIPEGDPVRAALAVFARASRPSRRRRSISAARPAGPWFQITVAGEPSMQRTRSKRSRISRNCPSPAAPERLTTHCAQVRDAARARRRCASAPARGSRNRATAAPARSAAAGCSRAARARGAGGSAHPGGGGC